MAKKRLDQLVVERKLAPSREKAQALIMCGAVLVDDVPAAKAGVQVDDQAELRLRDGALPKYVGRGGEKIEPALKHFGLPVQDAIALDIGASTGGFTDCLLQHGAKLVYAVDVGFNQLDYRLRQDSRVVVIEKTHALDLTPGQFDPPPTIAVIDVSFIGVRKILGAVLGATARPCEILALVKPQFELGPENVSKGGVVRDEKLQLEAVELVAACAKDLGLFCNGSLPAGLRGKKKGNQEYFVSLRG